jgi:hypothetical protein
MKVATRNFVNPLDPHFQELVTSIRKELPAGFFFLGNDTIFRLFYKGDYKHPDNALTGFAIHQNKCIFRSQSVTIDKAWFGLHGDSMLNAPLCKIDNLLRKKEDFILEFNYARGFGYHYAKLITRENETFVEKFNDEVGELSDISDISSLKIVSIPKVFSENNYKLVGHQFYAPYTKLSSDKTIDVLLYAELNNNYDNNAIKVLRWVRKDDSTRILYDLLCDLGYISREQNKDLHSYMVENNCRLLFGKLVESTITILGGLEIFYTEDYKFPLFLDNIEIL